MAAQVLSGRLVYDSSDSFDTSYGLCFHLSFPHTHKAKPKSTVCDWFVFSLGSCSLSSIATHTAFVNAVCQGLRPRVSGCSAEMKALVSACWDAKASCRPCLSSFPLFSIFSLFFLVPFFTLHSPFCMHTHQHLMSLLTHSVHSIDSPLHPMCVIHHHKHTHSHKAILESQWIDVCISQCALFAVCHPHCLLFDRGVCVDCHSFTGEWV